MTGYNLPPGCNVRDIPGNRPEDQALEALYDDLFDKFYNSLLELYRTKPSHLDQIPNEVDEVLNEIGGYIEKVIEDAFGRGYSQGKNDTRYILGKDD